MEIAQKVDYYTFQRKNKKNQQYSVVKVVYFASVVSINFDQACQCLLLDVAV